VEVDPAASMRCWAIELELGGRTFDVPALPAADWWPVLTSRDPSLILDFVVSTPDDPANLDDLLLAGEVDQDELGQALIDAMEAAAGRSLHVSMVLATVAEMHWASINGALVRRGFRWEEQPLGAALDAIYAEVTARLDEEALGKFEALLDDESVTRPGKKRTASQKVRAEFEAMAGPRPTAGAGASAEPSDSERPRSQPQPQRPLRGGPSRAPRPPRGGRAGSGRQASS
jgi:hypothetical protein